MLSLGDTIFNTEVDITKLSRLGLFVTPVQLGVFNLFIGHSNLLKLGVG